MDDVTKIETNCTIQNVVPETQIDKDESVVTFASANHAVFTTKI